MKDFIVVILLCSIRLSALVLIFSIILNLFGSKITAGVRYTIWRILDLIAVIPINFKSSFIKITSCEYVANTADISGKTQEIITDTSIWKSSIDVWQVLFVFWLTGAMFFLIHHVIKNFSTMSFIKRWCFSDENSEKFLAQVKNELNIHSNVKFYRSKTVSGPIAFGLLNHTVVIPLEEYSNEELTLIFKHELIHISRRDSLFKLIAMLAASIHWFNPFIYLFLHQFNSQCELSCDEKITYDCSGKDRFKYGELILNSAIKSRNYFELYTSMSIKNSLLKLRLEKIICGGTKKNTVLCTATLAILIASALVMQCTVGYAKSTVSEYQSHNLTPTDNIENMHDGTRYQETIHTTVTLSEGQSTKSTDVTVRQSTHATKQRTLNKKSTAKTTAQTTQSTNDVNDTIVKSSAYGTQSTKFVNSTTIKSVGSTSAATHSVTSTIRHSAVNTTTPRTASNSTTRTVANNSL